MSRRRLLIDSESNSNKIVESRKLFIKKLQIYILVQLIMKVILKQVLLLRLYKINFYLLLQKNFLQN